MNELMVSLAGKLDMTYDAVVSAYPEIVNQVMYYNIISSFRPLIYFAIALSLALFITFLLHSKNEPEGLDTLLIDLEGKKRMLNHAMANKVLYDDSKINEMEIGIKAKQIEIEELKERPKNKYGKLVKYSAVSLIVSLLLLLGSAILISVLAKDYIALSIILSGLK